MMLLEDLVKLFPIMVVRNNRHWKLLTFSQKFTSTESLMVFRQQEFSSLLHNIVLQLGKQKDKKPMPHYPQKQSHR